jgi:hypothetical protein
MINLEEIGENLLIIRFRKRKKKLIGDMFD